MQIIPFFHQRRFGEWPASQASDWHQQTWVWYDSLFYSIQLSLRKFWFDTTHDSQWRYRNWFKSTEYSKCISEIFFKSTHDSKKTFRILNWINSWHNDAIHSQFHMTFFGHSTFFWKPFPFLGIQLNCWLGDLFWWPILETWYSSVNFVWPFKGFRLKCIPDKLIRISSWLKQYLGNLNRFNSLLKRLSRNWLWINSWVEWIPKYWFRSTRDWKCFPILWFK